MQQIKITITALEPLVITSSSGDTVMTPSANYISGTMVRGVFADRYIKEQQLGVEAHESADFRCLFFDKLRFTNAMPAYNGQPAFQVPFSIQKNKLGTELKDLLQDDNLVPGFKGVRGMAVIEKVEGDHYLHKVSVAKNISFHMSRSSEEERLMGRSKDGMIFNYESIDANQQFIAYVIGAGEDLQKLYETMGQQSFNGRVGRSRFTQYGSIKVQLGAIEDIQYVIKPNKNNEIFIHVLSPTIPAVGTIHSAEATLSGLKGELLEGACITKVFASVTEVDNFVNIWGMKRPRVQALAAGTIYAIKKDNWDEAVDAKKLYAALAKGLGQRTQEGFGQLSIWEGKDLIPAKKDAVINEAALEIVPMAKNVAARIVEKYILEHLKQIAFEDALKLRGLAGVKTHFFARLLQELSSIDNAANARQIMLASVENARTNSPYAKGLQKISLKGKHLEDWFKDSKLEMAYIDAWHTEVQQTKLGELMAKIGMHLSDQDLSEGRYFYTYWYWLFRYACKVLASKGGR